MNNNLFAYIHKFNMGNKSGKGSGDKTSVNKDPSKDFLKAVTNLQ